MTSADHIRVEDCDYCVVIYDDRRNEGDHLWASPARMSGATRKDKALAYRVRDAIRARIDDYEAAAESTERWAVFEFIDDVVSGLEPAGREA